MRSTTYFRDFYVPVEFPAWALRVGFEDQSWHNDAMCRATLHLPQTKDDPEPLGLTLWVSPKQLADREFTTDDDHHYPRFSLVLFHRHATDDSQNLDLAVLYSGEDPVDCEVALCQVLDLFNQRKGRR